MTEAETISLVRELENRRYAAMIAAGLCVSHGRLGLPGATTGGHHRFPFADGKLSPATES